MLVNIIKKSIEDITLEELYQLYNNQNIATIKVNDNQLEFIQE